MLNYVKSIAISLKGNEQYNEKWLQDRIVDDPAILGLGDLEVKDVERAQPKAGRLDLLLRDPESGKRFEVELMLGSLDASHIIRTLEYWDIERKRYPQYDHCAVIVAEDVTSRFLNVISLFNSAIPIIAIQLNAIQVDNNIVLTFTKVLDEVVLGEDDEDDDGGGPVVDRNYWQAKASAKSLQKVDACLSLLQEVNPALDLKYNKHYIGLTENGIANNFVLFRPRKSTARALIRVSNREEWIRKLEDTSLDVALGSKGAPKRIVVILTQDSISSSRDQLKEVFAAAYEQATDHSN